MVIPTYYPIVGGAESVVRYLSMGLSKMGIHADVMSFNMDRAWSPKWSGKIEKIDGITIFKIPGLNWLPILHSSRVKLGVNLIPGRFLNLMKDYDIIHFHEAEFSFPLFSSFVRKPKILHLHGLRRDFFERYYLSRMMLKNAADIYLCLTNQMKRDLATLRISQDRIVNFPNAVDTEVFYPQEKLDGQVLCVSRITPEKGLHILLRSLRYVKKSVSLKIAGPLDCASDYYRKILELIQDENQSGIHNIEYLGKVDQTTLQKLHQKASIYVQPSTYEPFSIAVLEAMSCETPVIATKVGGMPEVIENGETGIIVPADNPLKLAEAINYLLENKDIRVRFGEAGRKRVKKNFTVEVLVKKLIKIYEKMTDNQK
jgi:glycosyltransferase involved in cell wall biosynthesis